MQKLGSTDTTAQVHPRKLTEAFMAKASELAGSEVRHGAIHDIQTNPTDDGQETITGVNIGADVIPADVVVIAMGPWSQLASAWLPLPMAVSGQKYHSMVVKPSKQAPAHALFTTVRRKGVRAEPEIYTRPHGEVYVCGEPESPPLPSSPSKVAPREGKCETVLQNTAVVASGLADGEVLAQQACFLPMTPDGVPVMGQIPGVIGGYVATGHSCWGILNAPATGLVMSELILDGKTSSLDISRFSPMRFA